MALNQYTCGDHKDKMYFVDDISPQDVPKLLQPKNHKAKVSVWTELSVNAVDVLSTLTSTDSIRSELANIFSLEDWKVDTRKAILLDLYYYTVQFARDNHFSKQQTSAFFAIVKNTHEVCVETPFGNLEQCFQFFKDMVLCHAVKRPPFSIDVFNADEVRKISEYVINTYFRHYKLYKYAFTPKVTLDLSFVYTGEPTPAPDEVLGKEEENMKEDEVKEPEAVASSEDAKSIEETSSPEAEAAMTELRRLVREHLTDELKKLRASVDQQIKASEDVINKKLEVAESANRSTTATSVKSKDKKK